MKSLIAIANDLNNYASCYEEAHKRERKELIKLVEGVHERVRQKVKDRIHKPNNI